MDTILILVQMLIKLKKKNSKCKYETKLVTYPTLSLVSLVCLTYTFNLLKDTRLPNHPFNGEHDGIDTVIFRVPTNSNQW